MVNTLGNKDSPIPTIFSFYNHQEMQPEKNDAKHAKTITGTEKHIVGFA